MKKLLNPDTIDLPKGWRVRLEYHLENDQNILYVQHNNLCAIARLPHKSNRSLLKMIIREQVCAIQAIEKRPSDYVKSLESGLFIKRRGRPRHIMARRSY